MHSTRKQSRSQLKTATKIRDLDGFTGHAALFKMAPPLGGHVYVIVSATVAPFSGPETYIFPSNKKGEVTDWMELDGSQRGVFSHRTVLEEAGYQVEGDGV